MFTCRCKLQSSQNTWATGVTTQVGRGTSFPLQPAKGLPHFITFGEEREAVRRTIAWPPHGGQAIHANPIGKAALRHQEPGQRISQDGLIQTIGPKPRRPTCFQISLTNIPHPHDCSFQLSEANGEGRLHTLSLSGPGAIPRIPATRFLKAFESSNPSRKSTQVTRFRK
jgi:hypothetical protein